MGTLISRGVKVPGNRDAFVILRTTQCDGGRNTANEYWMNLRVQRQARANKEGKLQVVHVECVRGCPKAFRGVAELELQTQAAVDTCSQRGSDCRSPTRYYAI